MKWFFVFVAVLSIFYGLNSGNQNNTSGDNKILVEYEEEIFEYETKAEKAVKTTFQNKTSKTKDITRERQPATKKPQVNKNSQVKKLTLNKEQMQELFQQQQLAEDKLYEVLDPQSIQELRYEREEMDNWVDQSFEYYKAQGLTDKEILQIVDVEVQAYHEQLRQELGDDVYIDVLNGL